MRSWNELDEVWYQQEIRPGMPPALKAEGEFVIDDELANLLVMRRKLDSVREMILRRHGVTVISLANALKQVDSVGDQYAKVIALQLFWTMTDRGERPDKMLIERTQELYEQMNNYVGQVNSYVIGWQPHTTRLRSKRVPQRVLLAAKTWWMEQLEAER